MKNIHIGYFIEYNLSNICKIWNANKNKITKIKHIIFGKNSCYSFININLNQFIKEPFIEVDLLELIQLDFIDIIEIDSKKTKIQFMPIKTFIKNETTQ